MDGNCYLHADIIHVGMGAGGLVPCSYGQAMAARRFLKHNRQSVCVIVSGSEFHWVTVFGVKSSLTQMCWYAGQLVPAWCCCLL